jgi:hypothetical protein
MYFFHLFPNESDDSIRSVPTETHESSLDSVPVMMLESPNDRLQTETSDAIGQP